MPIQERKRVTGQIEEVTRTLNRGTTPLNNGYFFLIEGDQVRRLRAEMLRINNPKSLTVIFPDPDVVQNPGMKRVVLQTQAINEANIIDSGKDYTAEYFWTQRK